MTKENRNCSSTKHSKLTERSQKSWSLVFYQLFKHTTKVVLKQIKIPKTCFQLIVNETDQKDRKKKTRYQIIMESIFSSFHQSLDQTPFSGSLKWDLTGLFFHFHFMSSTFITQQKTIIPLLVFLWVKITTFI